MLWKIVQKELDKSKCSLHHFSKVSGIPESTLKKYKFNGSDPSFTNACKIADALGVSLDDLRVKPRIKHKCVDCGEEATLELDDGNWICESCAIIQGELAEE